MLVGYLVKSKIPSESKGNIKNLLKFAAGTTLVTLMTAVAALLRGKLAAIILGTAGVGLFGQVDSFYRGLVQICILSTGAAVTRCVAELHGAGDTPGIRRAFWSITAFSIALAVLVAGLVLLFSSGLSGVVLSDRRYGLFLAVVALGLPLQALSDIIMGMLVGLRDLRAQVWITAIYTAGGLVLYTILILRYGLAGAIYSGVAIAACSCLVSVLFLYKRRAAELRPVSGEKHFDLRLLRFILAIGLSGGTMAIGDRLVLLAFRTILIRRFGFEANGLYQAVYSLSQLTIALAFGFVNTYLVPTLSGLQDPDRTHVEFSSTLRFTLLIATVCSAVTILFGKFVILAAYSSAFLGAVPLLRYQALGDFFRALTLFLSASIFALSGWKPWFGIGMFFLAANMLFFALLLPIVGLPAISLAYLLAHGTSCGLAGILFTRYTKLRFAGRPLLLRSLALLLAVSALAFLGNVYLLYIAGTAALLLWAKFAFTSTEYRRLWSYVWIPLALSEGGDR